MRFSGCVHEAEELSCVSYGQRLDLYLPGEGRGEKASLSLEAPLITHL